MKLGRKGSATIIGATYKMNPTKMIMKQGSKESRAANARSAGVKKSVTRPVKGKTK